MTLRDNRGGHRQRPYLGYYIEVYRAKFLTTDKEFVGRIGPVYVKSAVELPGFFKQIAYAQKDAGPYDWYFKPISLGVIQRPTLEKLDRPNQPTVENPLGGEA